MEYPLSVRRENEKLAKALGSSNGIPLYKWAWSSDITHPMVIMDSDNKVIYDYQCQCGMNIRVHSANCQLTIPIPHVEVRSLVPDLHSQWVLVKWLPPQVSESEWNTAYQCIPYPRNGSYVPVGDKSKCISIPSGSVPLPQTTDLVIATILEHFLRVRANEFSSDAQRIQWAKGEKAFRDRCYDAARDAIPVHLDGPGKKGEWSAGGIGDSPILKPKGTN